MTFRTTDALDFSEFVQDAKECVLVDNSDTDENDDCITVEFHDGQGECIAWLDMRGAELTYYVERKEHE